MYSLRVHNPTHPKELFRGYKRFCSAFSRPSSQIVFHLGIDFEIMSMRIVICCPHCESKAVARSSQQMSATLREITYQCTDVYCGHTYVANLEIVRTLSPSAKPNAAIDLPVYSRAMRTKNKSSAPSALNL